MFNQLKNQFQDLSLFWRGIRGGEYPVFVTRPTVPVTIPVFSYHRVLADEFEMQLKYLQENGYQTLSADAYLEKYKNEYTPATKEVVLTFDDGLENLYEIAFPLLKKYGMMAVAFIIANKIGAPGMINWKQVNEMHRQGVMDFQSHSLDHTGIFTSPRLIRFYDPQYNAYQDWNIPVQQENRQENRSVRPEYGMPLYEQASRLSDHKRFYPPEDVVQACIQYVQSRGNESYFKMKKWAIRLRDLHDQKYSECTAQARFETEIEQKAAIFKELREAKEVIEQNIPGKEVNHFAFPWNETGKQTNQLLKKAGYCLAFGGLSQEYLTNGDLVNPFYINRVSGDFVFSLPGKGRLSMATILTSKIKRRIFKGVLY